MVFNGIKLSVSLFVARIKDQIWKFGLSGKQVKDWKAQVLQLTDKWFNAH